MPVASDSRASTSKKESPTTNMSRSERDLALDAYIRGKITVDELLDIMDRRGSWINSLIKHMAVNPPSLDRLSRWMKQAAKVVA